MSHLRGAEVSLPQTRRTGRTLKRIITAVLVSAVGISALVGGFAPSLAGAAQAASSAPPSSKCPPGWYKNNQGKCYQMTSTGMVTMAVASAGVTLQAKQSRSTSGTRITIARVTLSHPHRSGRTFKVFATGKMPALTLTRKGSLYAYSPAHNSWSKISAITRPGIYEAVYA